MVESTQSAPFSFIGSKNTWKNAVIYYYFYQPGQAYIGKENPTPLPNDIQIIISEAMEGIKLTTGINLKKMTAPSQGKVKHAIVFANSSSPDYAYTYLPGNYHSGGHIFLNPDYNFISPSEGGFLSEKGDYGFATLLHEIGHALGLVHPFDSQSNLAKKTAPIEIDNLTKSVMSYTKHKYQPSTLMPLDIAVLMKYYKPVSHISDGDSIYTFSSTWQYTLGNHTIGAGKSSYTSLYDSNGFDLISLSSLSSGAYIDLTPGSGFITDSGVDYSEVVSVSGESSKSIAPYGTFLGYNTYIEAAQGSDFSDIIIGNNEDNLFMPGKGNDILQGGLGADVFEITDGSSENYKIIKDFNSSQGDKIYLNIYADPFKVSSALLLKEFTHKNATKWFKTSSDPLFNPSNQFITYDNIDGSIWLDLDGSENKIEKIKLAELQNKAELNASNFIFSPIAAMKYIKPLPTKLSYETIDWSTFSFQKLALSSHHLKHFKWKKVDWSHIEYDEYTFITWNRKIIKQVNKAADFNFEAMFDSLSNSITINTVSQKKIYSALNWKKVNFKTLSADVQSQINFSLIPWKGKNSPNDYINIKWELVKFEYFNQSDLKSIKWNKVNALQFTDTQYQSIDWSKVSFKGKHKIDYTSLDWDKVILHKTFGKQIAKKINWIDVNSQNAESLSNEAIQKLSDLNILQNGSNIINLFPKQQGNAQVHFQDIKLSHINNPGDLIYAIPQESSIPAELIGNDFASKY